MAISRQKKETVVSEIAAQLSASKMTAVAQYQGLSVAEVQQLRRAARENGTSIKVVKNRLVRVALSQIEAFKDVDASSLNGQLLYAFNEQDEVAAAQVLANFAKTHPALQLTAAISGEGTLLSADEVKALASLPNKNQLIGEVIAQLLSPVNDVTNALSGNLHALLDGIEAKATS